MKTKKKYRAPQSEYHQPSQTIILSLWKEIINYRKLQ